MSAQDIEKRINEASVWAQEKARCPRPGRPGQMLMSGPFSKSSGGERKARFEDKKKLSGHQGIHGCVKSQFWGLGPSGTKAKYGQSETSWIIL